MTTMKKILIVDDDTNFLLSLADGLKADAKNVEVLIAENGKEAVNKLRKNKIELLVTDIKMPEMDGLELLAHMVNNYPNIPVIVMTAFATREIEDRAANMGSFRFLEKPLDFHVLMEKINEGLDVGSHYYTKVVSLCSFLQTVVMETRTCMISVRSNKKRGYLYFFKGVLIDGETGDLRGAAAVYNIVSWEDAEIEINVDNPKEPGKIDTPLNFIVEEELHRRTYMAEDKKNAEGGGVINKAAYLEEMEGKMNKEKIQEAIRILKKDLDDGLVNTGIMSRLDGRIILEFNVHPKTGIFFKQLTSFLSRMLSECNLPPMGKYYLIDLEGSKSLIAIPHMNFIWGITIDLSKVALGLFLNVTLPKILKAFNEAVTL
jgi:CheY-like chemotaxis protein